MSEPARVYGSPGLETLIGRERDEELQHEVAAAMRRSVGVREVHVEVTIRCRAGRVVEVVSRVVQQRTLGV